MRQIYVLFFVLISLKGISQSPKLLITPLAKDVYVYTTSGLSGGKLYPSNGMYIVTTDGVVVIDCPFDTTQFQPLLDSIEKRHKKKVILNIATHFHSDRTGAFDFMRAKGIATWSSSSTLQYCKQRGEQQAANVFTNDTSFRVGQYVIETYFPGEGHSKDNIVIWLNEQRVLFGGCLVKSVESSSKGNIADANLAAWPATIRTVQQKFPKPAFVIPGHDGWQSVNALEHTIQLVSK